MPKCPYQVSRDTKSTQLLCAERAQFLCLLFSTSGKQCVSQGNSSSGTSLPNPAVSAVISPWLPPLMDDSMMGGVGWPRGDVTGGSKAVLQEDLVAAFPSQNWVVCGHVILLVKEDFYKERRHFSWKSSWMQKLIGFSFKVPLPCSTASPVQCQHKLPAAPNLQFIFTYCGPAVRIGVLPSLLPCQKHILK